MFGLASLGAIVADPELRRMFGQLASRKIKADLKTIEAHSELSRQLAAARRRPGDDGAALRRIVREHLEYYGTLIDLSHSFHQRLIDLLSELSKGGSAEPAINGLTMLLKAPKGATVRAPFKITNNRSDSITVTCRSSPFVSEDGTQLIASRIAFLPPGADIAPGSEEVFEVIVPIGPDFAPGRTYLATLAAEGLEAMEIVLRLEVEPAGVPAAPAQDDAGAAGSPARAARSAAPARRGRAPSNGRSSTGTRRVRATE